MRILIVDDHPIYAEGLRNLLRSYDYMEVEIARGGEEAVKLATSWSPEVVLMDISMPGMDGIEATRVIKDRSPEIKIIILTSLGDSESLIEAVKAGASGYLVKTLDGEELIDCIRQLQAGKNSFSAGLGEILLSELRRSAGTRDWKSASLGDKSRTILGFLAAGLTYKEIGLRLNLSDRTIKYHVEQAKSLLGLDSRAELIAYWRKNLEKDA